MAKLFGRFGKERNYEWVAIEFSRKNGRPVEVKGVTSYFIRYTDAEGKRKTESVGKLLDVAVIGLRNRQAAENGGEQLVQQFREHAPEITTNTTVANMTFREAFEDYTSKLQNKAKRTVESYRPAIEEFIMHCGDTHSVPTTAKDARPYLLSYRKWLYERSDIGETTRYHRLLRAVIFLKKFGVKQALTADEWPVRNVKTPQAYSLDEIQQLLGATETREEKLLVEFFLYTGARDGEVMHAVKSDIKISKGKPDKPEVAIFSIQAKDGWRTKGKRDREVRLPLDFAKRLLDARKNYADNAVLFPNSKGLPNSHLLDIVQSVAKRTGVRKAGLHKFRATYATLKGNHTNIQSLKQSLGHRDIKTTERYLEANDLMSEAEGVATENAFGEFGGDAS